MKIGFDASQTGGTKAGCGYFAFSLGEALKPLLDGSSVEFYPSFGDRFFDPALVKDALHLPKNFNRASILKTSQEAAAFWRGPNLDLALGVPDVIHCNNFWCPQRHQVGQTRLVYTLYDLSFMIHPDWTTEANRQVCLSGMFNAAANADWILAISDASKRDFCWHFPHFPRERIKVIYPASRFRASGFAMARPSAIASIPENRFWLSVGTIEPRKNQRMLVEAYRRYLARSSDPLPLVFAGGAGWKMDDFRAEIVASGLGRHIHFTGYVSDENLAWLYSNCRANLYPSHFEGFGLPVLEGMTFGAATLSSNTSSLPEVCGTAAMQLPPGDFEAWAAALVQLETNDQLQSRLQQAACIQATQFNWSKAAAETMELYRQAIAEPLRSALPLVDSADRSG